MDTPHTPKATPLPVICEHCRAQGLAGDDAFAAIPDLLDFEPVPRRARSNGWTPEHQRAFIAALAITGSARQAARHVGRATYGAEQLRTAKGSKGFADAWDAALELAKDRELARLHESLGDLAKRTEAEAAKARAEGRPVPGENDGEDGGGNEIEEVRQRIFDKLERLRQQVLREEIIPFPEKRAAWIVLNGEAEIDEIEGGSTEGKATGGEADTSTSLRDEHRSHAGVHGEKRNGPVRPTTAKGESIDGADSLRDGAAPSSPPPKPKDKPGPRVRRL